MEQIVRLQYEASISNMVDVNESFASAELTICYPGLNRNNTSISREVIESELPTAVNCPIVCNYDVESNTIGAHDQEIVKTDDGDLRLVNMTDAIGVVPAGAKFWWSDEDDHEYLHADALLWKRSPAYAYVKEHGIVGQSMEIVVRSGRLEDNVFTIEDFYFTAFCLLGADHEPCFEGASLRLYDLNNVADQFSDMLASLKSEFENVELEYKEPKDNENVLKGGSEPMPDGENFELAEQFRSELIRALSAEAVNTDWGCYPRYYFEEYDPELSMVYCRDTKDWVLYGMSYSMDGDNVIVNFESKARKKYSIVDFNEGESAPSNVNVFALAVESMDEAYAAWSKERDELNASVDAMTAELDELRKFKSGVENQRRDEERTKVFNLFADLVGIEAFEALKANADLSVEDLEEKCYAIRGRNMKQNFSLDEPKLPKLDVTPDADPNPTHDDEPYNGMFVKYNIH